MENLVPVLLYIRNFREYNHRDARDLQRRYTETTRENASMLKRLGGHKLRMEEIERQIRLIEHNSRQNDTLLSISDDDDDNNNSHTNASKDDYSYNEEYMNEYEDEEDYEEETNDDKKKFNYSSKYHQKEMCANIKSINEKRVNKYELETLKIEIEELEDNFYRLQKDLKEKTRSYDLLKRNFNELKNDCEYLKECLKQKDQLIENNGLVLINNVHDFYDDYEFNENDDIISTSDSVYTNHLLTSVNQNSPSPTPVQPLPTSSESKLCKHKTVTKPLTLSKKILEILNTFDGSNLEDKIYNLINDKTDLNYQLNLIKNEIERQKEQNKLLEESSKFFAPLSSPSLLLSSQNGCNSKLNFETQKENKLLDGYRCKLKKASEEIINLQNTINRLENQLDKLGKEFEDSEKREIELKSEKRQLLREFREKQSRIEELESANSHLQRRINKLNTTRMNELTS